METTVLLVDDNPLFRKGLRQLLEDEGDLHVVGEAGDGLAAIELVAELSPDVVVMDIIMPDLDGIQATRQILAAHPTIKIVALSIDGEKRYWTICWGANDPHEASYPLLQVDGDGNKLDASKHNYTMTFAKGKLPPVKAFWSLTMYDGKTQLMIDNPINRYLLNSPMLPDMKTGADGSLTLYLLKDSPGKELEANWLPAPNGPFYVLLRLYWPEDEFLDKTWKVSAIQ